MPAVSNPAVVYNVVSPGSGAQFLPPTSPSVGNLGPIEFGGFLYSFGFVAQQPPVDMTVGLGAFSSLDGVHWTQQNAAAAPPFVVHSPIGGAFISVFYPRTGGGNQVTVAMVNDPNLVNFPHTAAINLWRFTMTAGGMGFWSGPFPTGFTYCGAGDGAGLYVVVDGSGNPSILYTAPSSGGFSGNADVMLNGTLLEASTAAGAPGQYVYPTLLGVTAAGAVVAVWNSEPTSLIRTNTGGSLAWPALFGINGFPGSAVPWIGQRTSALSNSWNSLGVYVSGEDLIAWHIPFWTSTVSDFNHMNLVVLTVKGAAITITSVVASLPRTTGRTVATDLFVNSAGGLTAMWADGTLQQVAFSTAAVTTGAWSGASVFWSQALNPAVTPPTINFPNIPNQISARQLALGVGVLIGVNAVPDGVHETPQDQFFVGTLAAPPAAIAPAFLNQGGGGRPQIGTPGRPKPIPTPPRFVRDCYACACGICRGVLPLPASVLDEIGLPFYGEG